MWPWEAFGVQTVVTPVSKGKRPRTTSPAESEEEAGRPPSASRAKRGRGRSMGAKSGGPRASRGKPRERAAPLAPSPGRTRTAGEMLSIRCLGSCATCFQPQLRAFCQNS